jgi:HlyD family secretion protein
MKIKTNPFKNHCTSNTVIMGIVVTATALFSTTAGAAENQPGAVSALGRLQPQNGIIHLGAPSTPESISGSLLSRLYVKEGDVVEAGTLLAVTDSAPALEARLNQANAELGLAKQSARATQSQADEACVNAEVSLREAKRREQLLDRKLASQEETEAAQGEAEASAASCTAGRANAQVSLAAIEVAKARVAVAEAELERAYVKSPYNGLILKVKVHPGEFIGAEGLIELGRVDMMYAVAEVYETDIRRVKTGQTATISSSALPHDLTGKVELIRNKVLKQDVVGTDPAADKDARIIEVEILLDDPTPAASMTNLQVEIIIDV